MLGVSTTPFPGLKPGPVFPVSYSPHFFREGFRWLVSPWASRPSHNSYNTISGYIIKGHETFVQSHFRVLPQNKRLLNVAVMPNTETAMPKRPGRPPLGMEALMTPRTIRLPRVLLEEIEAIQRSRQMDQPEFGQIVRELLAEAVHARKARGRK